MKMSTKRLGFGEQLEQRTLLTTIAFVPAVLSPIETDSSLIRPSSGQFIDVDSDGDFDIAARFGAAEQSIEWIENGAGEFSSRHLVRPANRGTLFATSDVDGDGDGDFVILDSDELLWLENVDGQGSFAPHQLPSVVATESARAELTLADLDGNGFDDIIVGGREFSWLPNESGVFGEPRKIEFPPLSSVVDRILHADVDGDGDIDLVTVSGILGSHWLENIDGTFVSHVLPGFSMLLVDFDGDGQIDVLAEHGSLLLNVSEQLDANEQGEFGIFDHEGGIGHYFRGGFVVASDFDGDSQLDFVGNGLWFVAADSFDPRHISNESMYPVDYADFDSDGDADLLAFIGNDVDQAFLVLFENRLIGDSNDDATFDSSDFVVVFTAGMFETGIEATFDEGDWNQDGFFDSSDIVFAFQAGTYVAGPQ